jgi:uridine kinase
MSGERISWETSYGNFGKEILLHLREQLSQLGKERMVISIFGESGSGKTICALAIQNALEEIGIRSAILHMDGYFRLPPKKNHEARLANIHHVGPSEVNLDVLSGHIRLFHQGSKQLDVPITDYSSDTFRQEVLNLEGVQVLLAEGTYLGMIQDVDYRIYLSANYTQTLQNRQKRGRDAMDPFVEKVLAIEHQLVTHSALDADLVIDQHYTLHPNQKHTWPNQDSLSGRSGI